MLCALCLSSHTLPPPPAQDPVKKAWLEEKYGPRVPGVKGSTVYVSGRQRAKGEINGKSANLNNCLKNIVYPQYVGNPAAIPKEEVLVVFDADMQAKPYFFCKVGALGDQAGWGQVLQQQPVAPIALPVRTCTTCADLLLLPLTWCSRSARRSSPLPRPPPPFPNQTPDPGGAV